MEETVVVPKPTIMPESPKYDETSFVSTIDVGGEIRTTGGFDTVYPVPAFVREIVVTISDVI